MTKIRILPEQLANQIAAGEVVERPASVVKELVENSLDAGASRIEIEIEGGGTRLIRIIDDGEGMDEDDLLMSLERHGTSKIHVEEDLGAINTLGFRGEAVPSIGSVSKLTITSRPTGAELGTRVVLDYGKLTKVHEIGCSIGTTVEVRNLFGNTPARRKFLRTARTELGHIDEVVKNYALGSPEVSFVLRLDGRDTIHLDSTSSAQQRLANILRYKEEFIPVESDSSDNQGSKITGFLVPPERVTPGPAKLRLFVNGRAIKDRMISHAVAEGLRSFLMKGKNPSGLIHLSLSPDEVDVNVHPAKHEVRFRNSRDVHTLISRSVSKCMLDYQATVKARLFGKNAREETTPVPLDREVSDGSMSPPPMDYHEPVPEFSRSQDPQVKSKHSPTQAYDHNEINFPKTGPQNQPLFKTAEPIHQSPTPREVHPPLTEHQEQGQSNPHHNLLVIGQYDDLYIFCKNSEGLMVIDQHAAHERLLYEKYRKQYLEGKVTKQTLMFPETVELSLFQAQIVEKNEEDITRMGFSIREFGGNTFIVAAVPALAGTANPRELFLDLLEQFGSENSKSNKGGSLDTILATMACKAAVKGGTALSGQEIDTLLSDMAKADLFSHCPHGRPVIKQFSRDEIKKWFYRT